MLSFAVDKFLTSQLMLSRFGWFRDYPFGCRFYDSWTVREHQDQKYALWSRSLNHIDSIGWLLSITDQLKGVFGCSSRLRACLLTFFYLFAPISSSPKKPTWNEQVDISRSIFPGRSNIQQVGAVCLPHLFDFHLLGRLGG